MKKLTKKQQLAVDIAKDVIKWIRARKLKINNDGNYLEGDLGKSCQIRRGDQIQDHLPTLRRKCDVCAKGAIFLSYIELKNKIKFGYELKVPSEWDNTSSISYSGNWICSRLGDAFTRENLDLIESAFEVAVMGTSDYEAAKRAIDFGYKFGTPGKRMIAICQNIIENNGEFKP